MLDLLLLFGAGLIVGLVLGVLGTWVAEVLINMGPRGEI